MSVRPRLYVDSADVDRVGELLRDGLVSGVTTNPTILERSGRRLSGLADLYARWIDEGAQEVFFQAWGTDAASLRLTADHILSLGDRIAVKVPATREGFSVVGPLVDGGATVLVTAVYSAAQALAAAALGARYVAPYLGRLRDDGVDGAALITLMQEMCAGSATDVLAASLRTPEDIVELRRAGIPYFTASPDVILGLYQHDISDRSAAEFEAATVRISN